MAVERGDTVERRAEIIRGSNVLSDEGKRQQIYFLTAWCWMMALEPLCGSTVELGDGLSIKLFRSRAQIEGHEVPGVRVDTQGWLVIEGELFENGEPLRSFLPGLMPLWPIMVRNAPARGSGPWPNFLPQVVDCLRTTAQNWPR